MRFEWWGINVTFLGINVVGNRVNPFQSTFDVSRGQNIEIYKFNSFGNKKKWKITCTCCFVSVIFFFFLWWDKISVCVEKKKFIYWSISNKTFECIMRVKSSLRVKKLFDVYVGMKVRAIRLKKTFKFREIFYFCASKKSKKKNMRNF